MRGAYLLFILGVMLSILSLPGVFAADTCYSNVQSMPVSCSSWGTITSDTFNGCRYVTCSSDDGSEHYTAKACDKPGSTNPTSVELYSVERNGFAGTEICFADVCISTGKSFVAASYPVCAESSTCTPSSEVCDGVDNDCDDTIDENNVCGPACTPTTETCNSKDDDCDGQVDEGNVCSSSACYNSVKDVPVSCTSTITQDTWNGCRQVLCGTGANTIKTLACDKGGFFEVYKQSSTGTPPEVCFADTCIQARGYEKSSDFPICTDEQPPTCSPTTEVCDNSDNDCDGQVDEGNVCETTCTPKAETCNNEDDDCDGQIDEGNVCTSQTCYNSVQNIPASCERGSITQDTWNGCRKIVCSGSSNSLQVLACNKGGFFEMYKQAQTGSGAKICIDTTCIDANGFAKSSNFPICTGETTEPPPGQPDLVPLEVIGPAPVVAGELYNRIEVTFKNQGDATAAGGWLVRYFLSQDQQITSGDAFLKEISVDIPHEANATNTYWHSVRIPWNMPEGTYYYGAVLDEVNDVAESNEQNNALAGNTVQVTRPADFCQEGVASLPPYCNSGRITSDTMSGNCRELTCSNSAGSVSASACDKPSTGPTYFDITRTSMSGTPPELCIGGACVSDDTSFSRSADYPACTAADEQDLEALSVTGPSSITSGDTATVTLTMQNNGEAQVPAGITNEIYLSPDTTITSTDTLLQRYVTENVINPGQTDTDMRTVTIPSTASGTYYFGAIVDANDDYSESNEANNVRTGNQVSIEEDAPMNESGDPGATSSLFLSSGSLNGQSVSHDEPWIGVSPGQSVSGSVTVNYDNDWPAGTTVVMAMTPNWGDRRASCTFVDTVEAGSGSKTVPISVTPPSEPGVYRVWVAFRAELDEHDVCSSTSWTTEEVYGDWNDIANWEQSEFYESQSAGRVAEEIDSGDHHKLLMVPAASVVVNVKSDAPSGSSLVEDLYAYYHMNGELGDDVGGHNGAVIDPAVTFSGGKIGESADLSADASVQARMYMQNTQQATFALWAKADGTPGAIWSWPGRYELLRTADGRVELRAIPRNPAVTYIASSDAVPDGEWHHYAIVINDVFPDSDVADFYVDGVYRGSVDAPESSGQQPYMSLGAPSDNVFTGFSSDGFDGNIDEMGVWERLLSEDEIQALYNSGAGVSYPFGTSAPIYNACYAQQQDMPASCEGGTITQHSRHQDCSFVTCSGSGSELVVKACNKPGSYDPQFFEMYKESYTGSAPLKICLFGTCFKHTDSYIRSPDFPVCA